MLEKVLACGGVFVAAVCVVAMILFPSVGLAAVAVGGGLVGMFGAACMQED